MAALTVGVMLRSWDLRLGLAPEEVLATARLAEELGLDTILAGDHVSFHGFGNDALLTLTAIAAVTERIGLETSVYLLPLRHPVPVALQCAQLDQLSLGRLALGIGVGGEDPHEFTSSGVDPRTRGARTDEALTILRRLWTEDGVTFSGRHFPLDDVTVYPKPLGPLPIYVGGRSDAALRRAGRLGDGYTGIWLSPERFTTATAAIHDHAIAAGRDPAALSMGMQFWTGSTRELVAARMEATYGLPFERFERSTPFGTPAEVAAFIAPYVAAGATRINLVPAEETLAEGVAFAAAVKAALRGLRGLRTED